MNNNFVYLTIEQGFALISQIEELKKNPYFKSDIADDFANEVKERAIEITVNTLNAKTNLLQKLSKNGDKIKISKSKFEFVTRLTGIDVFDEETMKQHKEKVNAAGDIFEIEQEQTRTKR